VRWRRVAAGLAGLAVVAAGAGLLVTRGHSHQSAPPPVAEIAPAPVLTPTHPVAVPTHSAPPGVRTDALHQAVAPAVPTGFEIKGKAFDIKATVCQMPYVRPLDPPGDQRHTVCWVDSQFGVAPGSSAAGTSYILGHSWAEAPLVFNPLSITAMKQVDTKHPVLVSGVPTYPVTALNGYTVTLTTAKGRLTYAVRSAFAVSKEQAGNVAPLMATNTPNRVVIITCGVLNGQDIDDNVIVNAYLTSSVAR
jgi:hypothetical protein